MRDGVVMGKHRVLMILMVVLFTCASATADDGITNGVEDMPPKH